MGTGNGEKVEILLVEDNPDDVALTLNILKKARITNPVKILKDGDEALECILGTGRFANQPAAPHRLILLDLNLPRVHGLDVLRKIKSDERAKNLPVVILTSSQEERGVMQSYKLGAHGCIVKPFDIHKLMEALSELHFSWALLSREE